MSKTLYITFRLIQKHLYRIIKHLSKTDSKTSLQDHKCFLMDSNYLIIQNSPPGGVFPKTFIWKSILNSQESTFDGRSPFYVKRQVFPATLLTRVLLSCEFYEFFRAYILQNVSGKQLLITTNFPTNFHMIQNQNLFFVSIEESSAKVFSIMSKIYDRIFLKNSSRLKKVFYQIGKSELHVCLEILGKIQFSSGWEV